MKRIIISFLALFWVAALLSQEKSENNAPIIPQVQANFNSLKMNAKGLSSQMFFKSEKGYQYNGTTNLDSFFIQRMNSQGIPGLAACIIKDTSIIWTGSYGYANIDENRMVSDSTVFLLASISKPFVAVALMQLYEEGLFDLNDNINNYLPWSVNHPIYPDSIITFKMLLTHTSAINDNYSILSFCPGDSPIPLGEYLKDYLTPEGSNYDSIHNFSAYSPGSEWNYSRIGTALCAYLVEVITGTPFDQYCEGNIFKPLNMNETSWFLSGLDTSNIAMPYSNNVALGHFGLYDYPAGQLRTSSLQLARFLLAIKENGKIGGTRILDSTTVALMTTVHYGPLLFGSETDYQGLIWYKTDFGFGGRLCWGHEGLMQGVATTMFYFPDDNTGAIILANTEIRQMDAMSALFDYANLYHEPDLNEAIKAKIINIYPNPTKGILFIEFEQSNFKKISLEILDLSGKVVYKEITENRSLHQTFDLSFLSAGIYFVTIRSKEFIRKEKIVKL